MLRRDGDLARAAVDFASNVHQGTWVELPGATHNLWREPASADAAAAHIAHFLRR